VTATDLIIPSWYDLLGVEPDASAEEVRAAWKGEIADLEPGDRRFRLLNQAAEVLLDPSRRAAYDAELAVDEEEPLDEAGGLEQDGGPEPAGRLGSWTPPGWLIVAVGLVAAVVVGACTVLVSTQPSDASVADATRQAQAAAERAIVPVLSYNAAHLAEDQQTADGYLTADYRKKYDQLFEVIKQNAPRTKTVVTAQVVASGIVRSGDDRVSVLVFVNRPTTNKQVKTPVVYKDQVTVTMQKVGNDWLIDDLVTSPAS
jgi:Mce-associated membrane protein